MLELNNREYKMVAFDLDGTLAESKGVVPKSIASLLSALSTKALVVIISGGSFKQFEKQVLVTLEPSDNIILLPVEGSERYEYKKGEKGFNWEMTSCAPFSPALKNEVKAAFEEIIKSGSYDIPKEHFGPYMEDRETQITLSALGQEAPLEKKEAWDPDRSKRMKIKEALEAKVQGVSATVAGTTSIDVLPTGFDKAKGILLLAGGLGIEKNEIIFVGDAIVLGANDYPVKAAGIETVSVGNPAETETVLRSWLDIREQKKEEEKKTESTPSGFPKNPIVYFCAEYAIAPDPAMYAGGLGILAGDYALEAGDQDIPFIALGLKYGQSVPEGFTAMEKFVSIPIGTDIVKAEVWHKALSPNAHILLLDSGDITARLYDTDYMTRIRQQMVLGIGGIRLLELLGISPRVYHLNEGHTAFAGIALMLERQEDLGKIVATKHTILSAAGVLIKFADLDSIIGFYCKEFGQATENIFLKGAFELNTQFFSTTKFIMMLAVKKNGVSNLHVEFEKKRHPKSNLISITNGVYRKRWQAKELQARSKTATDEDLWNIKRKLRLELFEYIEGVSGKRLNPDICTLVWARRFASYKRPELLFTDIQRLMHILTNQHTPMQCVISGKAHQGDIKAEETVEKIIEFTGYRQVQDRAVYLPDYSIVSAGKLARGADIWLNTPERGMEACGTSGMKSSLNGALQCSISDGWVDEVGWGPRGWILPEENTPAVLYDLLEHEILPMFYAEDHAEWGKRMRSTIELVEKSYTATRMLKDYNDKLYTF